MDKTITCTTKTHEADHTPLSMEITIKDWPEELDDRVEQHALRNIKVHIQGKYRGAWKTAQKKGESFSRSSWKELVYTLDELAPKERVTTKDRARDGAREHLSEADLLALLEEKRAAAKK